MATNPATILEEARRLVRSGKLPSARRTYRKLVERYPSEIGLLLEFAAVEAQTGEFKSSKRLLDAALKRSPDNPDIHFNLGEVARSSGAIDVAIGHYRKAHSLVPDDADICYGLGEVLREAGEVDESLDFLERAAKLAPDDPEVRNALGIVREQSGDTPGAIEAYRATVTIDPRSLDGWCNLALASHWSDAHEDAATAFEKAQSIADGTPPAFVHLPWARTLLHLRRLDEALAQTKRAIEDGTDAAAAWLVRGLIEQQQGAFDAAEASFRACLALNPRSGDAYENLARLQRLAPDEVPAIESLLTDLEADKASRAAAAFALYSLLDRAGDTDAAFAALARANALKAEIVPFDARQHDAACDEAISVFDNAFFAARAGQGSTSRAPIFVLGMPRSGTTLAEQILAAYPDVLAGGEREDIQDLAAHIEDYPAGCRGLSDDWALAQAERILDLMLGADRAARFATNKSPGNYAFIGLIAWLFPNARIVYCKRDPLDIGFSSLEQNFRKGLAYTYDQRAFAHVYKAHERLMRHWFEVSPIPIHTVCYEDLAANPEPTARSMIEYCGLEWRPESLATHAVDRVIDTASLWQVRQPINTSSIGKWKRYERHLQPMIEALEEA